MTSTSVRPSSYNQSQRDPNTAAMLSFFLPGLGQMYNGETRKGMLFMCVSALNLVLFICLIFNHPILDAMLGFGMSFHMKPNGALAHVLANAGIFSSVGFILVGFFICYIAYAVRDAYDHAALKRRRIYPDFVIELPEANAGSYIFHFSIMVALFVIAFFFIIPPQPRAQITDIEFVQNQIPAPKPHPKPLKKKSDKDTIEQGRKKPNQPEKAPQPDPGPKQPTAQKQPQKPTPKPAQPTAQPKPAQPSPRPAVTPSPSPAPPSPVAPSPMPTPMPRVNSPSPSPSPSPAMPRLSTPAPTAMPRMTPSPMAMPSANPMPMAGAPRVNSASPTPSLAPSRLATAGTSTGAPMPIARPTGGSLNGLPSFAPSPVAIASSAGVPGFAPSPRSSLGGGGGSSNVGAGVPAPVTATSGGGGSGKSGGSSGAPSIVPMSSGRGGGGGAGSGPSSAPAPTRAGRGGGGGGWSQGPVSIMPSVPKGGSPGGGGDGSPGNTNGKDGPASTAASADVDFGPYMAELQRKIKRCWFPPRGQESRRVQVVFKIHSDGTMSNLRIEKTSGMDSADSAALQAVQNAAPFRPLPAGAPSVVDIQFTFDYNVFGGGRRF